MTTRPDLLRKYADIISEALTPPKPPFASYLGDAEWAEMVQTLGLSNAEKEARTRNPDIARSNNNANLERAKVDAQVSQLSRQRDPMWREKETANLQQQANNNAVKNMRDVMSAADIHNMTDNQLGQIGQMSSTFQPQNAQTNYKSKPGDVQLANQQRANITTLPPGAKIKGSINR